MKGVFGERFSTTSASEGFISGDSIVLQTYTFPLINLLQHTIPTTGCHRMPPDTGEGTPMRRLGTWSERSKKRKNASNDERMATATSLCLGPPLPCARLFHLRILEAPLGLVGSPAQRLDSQAERGFLQHLVSSRLVTSAYLAHPCSRSLGQRLQSPARPAREQPKSQRASAPVFVRHRRPRPKPVLSGSALACIPDSLGLHFRTDCHTF
jgi:hypothetical protein